MTRFAIVAALAACGGRLDVEGVDAAIDAKKDVALKDAGTQPDVAIVPDASVADPLCTAPADAATNGACVTIDGTNTTCNPVNNFGCDAGAGEACDLGPNGFQCFPPPNDMPLCASCDNQNGPFCMPTMHCVPEDGGGSGCARFCCDDTDCAGGKCDTSIFGQAPGLCVK